MAGGIEFNPGKFNELVLLIVELSVDDPRMSRVKLNKLLYRSDSEAFRTLGQSISGVTYVAGEFGPMATGLPFAEERLAEKGYLSYWIDDSGPNVRKVPQLGEDAGGGADRRQFSTQELEVVAAAIAELADFGGRAASDWAHEEWAGWRLFYDPENENQVIPYETVIIASEPGPPATVERLRRAVLSGNWDSDE